MISRYIEGIFKKISCYGYGIIIIIISFVGAPYGEGLHVIHLHGRRQVQRRNNKM